MTVSVRERLVEEWASLIESRSIKTRDQALKIAKQNVRDLELILFPYEGEITLDINADLKSRGIIDEKDV